MQMLRRWGVTADAVTPGTVFVGWLSNEISTAALFPQDSNAVSAWELFGLKRS